MTRLVKLKFSSYDMKGNKTMPNFRIHRINEEMQKEMAQIVRTIKDPRVQNHFISITHCDVTPDLKFAKIYFSVLQNKDNDGDNEEKVKEVTKGLVSSKGYIRREIAARLNLRNTPELTFMTDNSISHGAKITKILNELNVNTQNYESDEDSK